MYSKTKEKQTTANNKLSSSLYLGSIELNVKNIEIMKEFYHSLVGLDIINEDSNKVTLGKSKKPLIVLHQTSDLPQSPPKHAGLYHFAILYSSRSDLAKTVYRILKDKPGFFSGSADHLVSEAFYFNDPGGNGVELYFDRDRSQWQWENKQVKMATLYIDPVEYIQRHTILGEQDKEVKMGHFHLKVGDIEKARKFYVDLLGFDVTAELPGALFISVGGYHHHIGLNTWESEGADERSESLGLRSLELFLPDKKDMASLKERLRDNKVEFIEKDNSLILHDPWQNQFVIITS